MQKLGWTECVQETSRGLYGIFSGGLARLALAKRQSTPLAAMGQTPSRCSERIIRGGSRRSRHDEAVPGTRRAIAGRGMAGACANEGCVGCCGREGSRSAGLLGVEATDANEMASFAAWADARFCGLAVAGWQIGGGFDRLGRSCHWAGWRRPLKKQEKPGSGSVLAPGGVP